MRRTRRTRRTRQRRTRQRRTRQRRTRQRRTRQRHGGYKCSDVVDVNPRFPRPADSSSARCKCGTGGWESAFGCRDIYRDFQLDGQWYRVMQNDCDGTLQQIKTRRRRDFTVYEIDKEGATNCDGKKVSAPSEKLQKKAGEEMLRYARATLA